MGRSMVAVEGIDLRFIAIISISCMLAGPSARAAAVDEAADQYPAIVDKYVVATHTQQSALRGVQMEVDIDATIPKLHKRATFRALRTISRLGQITYRALGFSGDNTVKKEIITRYLAAEAEGRENGTLAITPENYKFKYKMDFEQDGRPLAILQVTPRKKAIGLFKGELWIDVETGMPVREAGEFVKSPSVFLKKIAFVRDYELRDGVAIPKRIESIVDTRVVGKAELMIHFSNFAKQGELADGETAPSGNAPGGVVAAEKLASEVSAENKAEAVPSADDSGTAPAVIRAPQTELWLQTTGQQSQPAGQ